MWSGATPFPVSSCVCEFLTMSFTEHWYGPCEHSNTFPHFKSIPDHIPHWWWVLQPLDGFLESHCDCLVCLCTSKELHFFTGHRPHRSELDSFKEQVFMHLHASGLSSSKQSKLYTDYLLENLPPHLLNSYPPLVPKCHLCQWTFTIIQVQMIYTSSSIQDDSCFIHSATAGCLQ